MELENVVYVYDKNMNLIAQFDDNTEGYDEKAMQNMMVSPTVSLETNGSSTLSFQMLANCEKWQTIKDPENIYYLNGRYYTALNENSYNYEGNGNIRIVNVTLVEIWYLLGKKYTQVYNCGLYTYAKCKFRAYQIDCIWVNVRPNYCSIPSKTISSQLAFEQVKNWPTKDADGNFMPLNVIQSKEFSPINWENIPSSVVLRSKMMMGPDLVLVLGTNKVKETQENYEYGINKQYMISGRPWPGSIKSIKINITTASVENQYNPASNKYSSVTVYSTEDVEIYADINNRQGHYYPERGYFTVEKQPASNQTFNFVTVTYDKSDFGEIGYEKDEGAWLTLGFGAEVVDEHTVCILPKADTKYKLTIQGVQYEDSEVKDARGVVMPRGSGGYAMWAILKNSGWSLGICDVIATGFNAAEDYGCFNVESDMKDVLYNVNYIKELYGGILDWDSENKILNYRAENDEDYQAYQDGFNNWTGFEFRQEKNMKDQPNITYDNNIITKGYILGYGNLNIKAVNDGKAYLEDYSFTDAVYEGYLEQPLIYDTNDETGQKQLKYWGQKELHKMSRPRRSVAINANDIRTAQGHEHEIFNLNDMVRVYFKDSEGDEETFELKRVTKWEYNAFALWDSTIELGDKTGNFVEVFKLIYKKAVEEAPQTNASGKIASSEIVLDVDLSEYGFETGGIGSGGAGISGSGYGYGTSLSDYIELIVQKTTQNSDAVSGLIVDADKLYAQTELFSTYQKQSDKMLSDAYAGIKLYTDGQLSSLNAIVNANYTSLSKDIGSVRSYAEAGFSAQASQNAAFSRQFASVESSISSVDGRVTQTNSALADLSMTVTNNFAQTALKTELTSVQTDLNSKVTTVSNSVASLEQKVTSEYATQTMLTSYATKSELNGVASQVKSTAEIKQIANAQMASIGITANWVNDITKQTSKIDVSSSGISMYSSSDLVGSRASVVLNTLQTTLKGNYTSIISENRLRLESETMITIVAGTYLTLNANTLSILGRNCSWQTITIDGAKYNILTG